MRLTDSALARYRHDRLLTAASVARELGVHVSMISKWESGAMLPSEARVAALALLYAVTPTHIRNAIERDSRRYLAKLNRQRRPRAAS